MFFLLRNSIFENMSHRFTNALINEKSPYLLQHAHNPVNWESWNEVTLQRAQAEDKLLLISVGYSACHWCHVMEHESFEDEAVASMMNEHFVCIKVDREERPDIDQVYMSAVQLMTGHGGWPLNCFALPDGRPIYGGTYFPKEQWIKVLRNLVDLRQHNRAKTEEYAAELTNGMLRIENYELRSDPTALTSEILHSAIKQLTPSFDTEYGGYARAPKFPLPNNWLFLLRYAHLNGDSSLLRQVYRTLNAMASGGIYDQIGGGFARYSTDVYWKVPHFEKMLYDNAQLISLFAEAYRKGRNENYKNVILQSVEFVNRELSAAAGGFFSALDADSEGEEGRFYVWTLEELKALIAEEDFELFSHIFSVNETGYWENENYILLQGDSLSELALRFGMKESALTDKVNHWKKLLLERRNTRARPGLDDKILTGWNAMMIRACCDAYASLGDSRLLQQAENAIVFIEKNLRKSDGGIFHGFKGGAYINGFLEDYVFLIDALLALYSVTGNAERLESATALTEYCFAKFFDTKTSLFYFTSSDDDPLVIRKTEITDNVIPASNSQMARNLFALYKITGRHYYKTTAEAMLQCVLPEVVPYPSGHSNWALLLMEILTPSMEVVVIGINARLVMREFAEQYLPNVSFFYSESQNESAVFKGRYQQGKTLIYVCRNNACQAPIETVAEALRLIN
jgi:uncharacterized protein